MPCVWGLTSVRRLPVASDTRLTCIERGRVIVRTARTTLQGRSQRQRARQQTHGAQQILQVAPSAPPSGRVQRIAAIIPDAFR